METKDIILIIEKLLPKNVFFTKKHLTEQEKEMLVGFKTIPLAFILSKQLPSCNFAIIFITDGKNEQQVTQEHYIVLKSKSFLRERLVNESIADFIINGGLARAIKHTG